MKIGIVGLGLIGGSMAKGASGKHMVYGADLRADVMAEALETRAIAAALDGDTLGRADL